MVDKQLRPEFVTYAACPGQVQDAAQNGFDLILLEDIRFSARTMEAHRTGGFGHILDMVNTGRGMRPELEFAFNLDAPFTQCELGPVWGLLEFLNTNGITRVRVQNAGLGWEIKRRFPDMRIHYAPHTNNYNVYSTMFWQQSGVFSRQVAPNELCVDDIEKNMEGSACGFEIQVLGPVLLQQSRRRLLAGIDGVSPHPDGFVHSFCGGTLKNRRLDFFTNRHGNFIYAWFDRCLLGFISRIADGQRFSWLFDGRDRCGEYLKTGAEVFRREYTRFVELGDKWSVCPESLEEMGRVCDHDFKPGFFVANNTDFEGAGKVRRDFGAKSPVGVVADVIKKNSMVLELCCSKTVDVGNRLLVKTFEGREIEFTVRDLETIGTSGKFVRMNWVKGATVKSPVFLVGTN